MARHDAARAGAVLGAAGVVVGSFLPWIVSGQTTRNSFSTVRTARKLDLVGSDLANLVLAGWFLVPLAAALVLLLALLGRRRTLAFVAGGLGTIATIFAGFVRLSPIQTASGPSITVVFGLVLMTATVFLLLTDRELRGVGRVDGSTDASGSNPTSSREGPPVA